MEKKLIKARKGGLDTIVAYIVVSLPLLYVLIYMVATIYHFSVQMYINQVVKETSVMISTYGAITTSHRDYVEGAVSDVFDEDASGNKCNIQFYRRAFSDATGIVSATATPIGPGDEIKKGDIVGVYVESVKPSMLGSVGAFSIFGTSSTPANLYYSAYREEIIRNERPD